jgi:D-sedoheptulose 7-phosphate isomerase
LNTEKNPEKTGPLDLNAIFERPMQEHLRVITVLQQQIPFLHQMAVRLLAILQDGGKIFWCGNGGSAADSQHLAAELVGRYKRERAPIPSVALTTDGSILTCVGNDYSYDVIFSRQVEALCGSKDALIGISTSGNSANVCNALAAAHKRGIFTMAFTGRGGGEMKSIAEHALSIGSIEIARIQEAHILVGHMLCDWIDLGWTLKNPA